MFLSRFLLIINLISLLLLCDRFSSAKAKSSTDIVVKSKKESLAYRVPIDPQHFYWPWELKILESDAAGNVFPFKDDNGQSGQQKWTIIHTYNDTFKIRNKQTHLCLESDLNGKVFTRTCARDSHSQKWEFKRGSKRDALKHYEWYWIRNEASKQLLDHDVTSVFTKNQEINDVNDSQKWHLYLSE